MRAFVRTLIGVLIVGSALMTALKDHPARERAVVLQTLAQEAESAAVLARDEARWIERARAERELESLKGALGADGEQELAALERLHQELRVGRVPPAKPASVPSP